MGGPLTAAAADYVRNVVAAWPARPSMTHMESLLRYLAKWRSQVLATTYVTKHGPVVWGGIFAGMKYTDAPSEGALMSRLLGSYESELHPHIKRFADRGLDVVIDVGCAEGYYAVGLARMLPQVVVHAYDIDAKARDGCLALAERNGVSSRVLIGEEFKPGDFETFAGQRVLVMVDAEGAELDVLQPALSPALSGMSLIVETHDVWRPGILKELVERFTPTHEIIRVDQQGKMVALPDWLQSLGHLDQLIAVWEWRYKPTPWLVMHPRGASPMAGAG